MTIVRIDEYTAVSGKAEELDALLRQALPSIMAASGCRSARLLRSEDDASRLVVLGEWDSKEAHRASLATIPSEAMADALQLLAAPPSGRDFRE